MADASAPHGCYNAGTMSDWPAYVEALGRDARRASRQLATLSDAVRSRALGRVAAEGSGIVVCYDYRQGVKVPLPPSLRARIGELEGWR